MTHIYLPATCVKSKQGVINGWSESKIVIIVTNFNKPARRTAKNLNSSLINTVITYA